MHGGRQPSVEFAIARDWYKVPAEGVAADDWRDTADGQRVSVGKPVHPRAMAGSGPGHHVAEHVLLPVAAI